MDVTITVKGAVATATPPPATSTTPPPATSTTPPPTIIPPQTGDESNLALYILLISMSLVVVSAVYIKAKKR
ncbi:MAG: sortase B protein-sorting domain-containing protein [Christensenellaceae bacterium]|nr:sortase B protein-sorting domain-containing protein [Christensenellaceae bacterium]